MGSSADYDRVFAAECLVYKHAVAGNRFWVGFCTCILALLLILYIPVYGQIQNGLVDLTGWTLNTSRNARIYVQPELTTSILEPKRICSPTNEPLLAVVVVCSSVDNFEARSAIRSTWGHRKNLTELNMRLVFLLGQTQNETLQDEIEKESVEHEDIIQEQFFDSYQNLTLKSIMLLKWAISHCSNCTKYVMKIDDDMFLNAAALAKMLKGKQQSSKAPLLVGSLICNAKPVKDPNNKWYSPNYMFEEKVYPNYLSGTAYVMSSDVAGKLFEASLNISIFHLEDVFLTGICARKCGIKPQNHPGFRYVKQKLDPCVYNDIITSHQLTPEELLQIHSLLQDVDSTAHCKRAHLLKSFKKRPKKAADNACANR